VGSVAVVLLVLLLVFYLGAILRRRGKGIVARRGMSVGADLAALADQPRVRVRAVSQAGPERVRVVFGRDGTPEEPLELVVQLTVEDFGWEQLNEWRRNASVLGIVMPEGSHIIRLRGIDDLQPLTLRRIDEG
jgi:hypothetical protein